MRRKQLPKANRRIHARSIALGQIAAARAFGTPVRVQPLGARR